MESLELGDVAVAAPATKPQLILYTTMATWCASCRRELPHLSRLRSRFSSQQLAMFGVPVDPEDGPAELESYLKEQEPAYELLSNLKASQIRRVEEILEGNPKAAGLPASILCDAEGRVLMTMGGAPSVSEVSRLLEGR